jgi:hypothetical protein
VNLDRLLPGRPFEAIHAKDSADGRERLRLVLAQEAGSPMLRWRVIGRIEGDEVLLWYTIRKRPQSLAPQLRARWEAGAGGTARMVGAFGQDRRLALAVMATGAACGVALFGLAARGAMPLHWAFVGLAFLVGYPWLAWFMYENHIEKIEALVARALGAAPDTPATAAADALPDEIR